MLGLNLGPLHRNSFARAVLLGRFYGHILVLLLGRRTRRRTRPASSVVDGLFFSEGGFQVYAATSGQIEHIAEHVGQFFAGVVGVIAVLLKEFAPVAHGFGEFAHFFSEK